MAWWIYLGKVTTPIDGGVTATLNEKGAKPVVIKRDPSVSTVLVPRLKFDAPMSSVAHLVRLKRVAALKPHQIPKDEPETKDAKTVPEKPVLATKSEAEPKGNPSDGKAPVVASAPEKADDGAGEEKTKAQQEKQEKGGSKGTDRRRG